MELEKLPHKKKRLEGGGRKALLPDMEEELVGWIEGCRSENFRVSLASVQKKAAELASVNGKYFLLECCIDFQKF